MFKINVADLDFEQNNLRAEYLRLSKELPSARDLINLAADYSDAKLNIYLQSLSQFFKKYDQFNMKKIDRFIEAASQDVAKIYAIIKMSKKAQKLKAEFDSAVLEYNQCKKYFSTNEDTKRLSAGIKIFPLYGKIVNIYRSLSEKGKLPSYGRGDLQPFVDTPKQFFQLLGLYVGLLHTLFFKAKVKTPDRAPIVESLAKIQKKIVEKRNIKVVWEGLKNLSSLDHDGKTLNIFVMNHANSFLDASVQSAFPFQGVSSIGDVEVFFPPRLAKQMSKSEHFVSIGHGDTDEKTAQMVKTKQLNKFFLAIEGITGVGFFEMRPIMPVFATSLYNMINKNIETRLYPVVYPDNFTLLNDWRERSVKDITAKGVIQKPISAQDCLNVKNKTKDEYAICQLIRWGWFENLNNEYGQTLAMPLPSVIANQFKNFVGRK